MIVEQLETAIRKALVVLGLDALADTISVERPAQREHGDWSSNVALVLAKSAGRNPRQLGQDIAGLLASDRPAHVRDVEVAGPGFINFHLSDSWLHEVLREVVTAGEHEYGRCTTGANVRVNVEFVSANPTGPLHAGHGRGACYGDSVARLLEAVGHPVEREFYVNDRGVQMEAFAASLLARKKGEELPDDGYMGRYVTGWAQEMPDEADPLEWGYARAKADQAEVLGMLGIVFDTWFSERSMIDSGAIDGTLADLRDRGVVYERDGATWLRSSDHGDDKDRVLIKSNGEITYLMPDIAYHRDKFGRADRLVDVLGSDHHGYVPRLKAALECLGYDPDELRTPITQMVKLMRGGEEVILSKRTGEMIELREIIDEIGADATRFTYLLQSIDSALVVDLELAASRAMENPVFYIQMAHARLRSIQAKASDAGITLHRLEDTDLAHLRHGRELQMLRQLHGLPEVVATAAQELAPHRMAGWLREFAAAVHGFHHDCHVIGADIEPDVTQARLWLVEAARIGLATGLALLGVSAPDSM